MEQFSNQDIQTFPAKTYLQEDGSSVPGISILQHGCLAGLVLKELLTLIRVQNKEELLPASLVTLAALHDVGKANPYFLRKLLLNSPDKGSWIDFISEALPDVDETPHPIVSAAVLKHLGAPLYCCRLVAMHHGHTLTTRIPSATADFLGGGSWEIFRDALAAEVLKQIGISDFPTRLKDRQRKEVQTQLWLGWVTLADWIASRCEKTLAMGTEAQCAATLVQEAGFRQLAPQSGKTFEQVFNFQPRPAQSLLLEAYSGPGVYVLEAPTGCGKTEAALGLAFEALNAGDASGVYFALPTQLTSNRAHERVQEAVGQYLGEESHVRLAHSGSRLQFIRMGKEAAPGEIWYTSSRLALLSPFGVGTVDQALMAILSTRFSQVRLAGLCGKVVILDEIHSYDAYMLELIARMVKMLEAMGAIVIILSATLTHAGLKKILGDVNVPESKGVVSLTVKTSNGTYKTDDDQAQTHPVAVRLLEDENSEEIAFVEALKRARDGMQVLWIENSVKAAQRIYERCMTEGVASGLLHSRFRSKDREVNESLWTELFGKAGKTRRLDEGRILVGTQVLEQSLDLDADFMVTRVAPLDLLVQRFGRLWRHGSTQRPAGCIRAESIVLAVREEQDISPVIEDGLEQPFGVTGCIYHPYHLYRTIEVLKDRLLKSDVLDLPAEVRNLLTAVFDEREEIKDEAQGFKRHLNARKQKLENTALGALSATHEQAEELTTRLIELPTWETIILFETDVKLLSGCKTPQQATLLLESCVLKSPRRLAHAGIEGLLDKISVELRPWASQARRFKSLVVCLCSPEGTLTKADGSPIDSQAFYSTAFGLIIKG